MMQVSFYEYNHLFLKGLVMIVRFMKEYKRNEINMTWNFVIYIYHQN